MGAETTNISMSGAIVDSGSDAGSIEELIPEELRVAAEKQEQDSDNPVNGPSISQGENNQQQGDLDNSDNVNTDDDVNNALEGEGDDPSDDLVIDDDAIDRLLDGDVDALANKSDNEGDDDPLAWHEDDSYVELLKKVNYTGVTQEDLDKIIIAASDKKVLENGEYTNGLKEKLDKLEKASEIDKAELDRLREIERLAHFDSSDDAKVRYGQPMAKALQEIQNVMNFEGMSVPINKVLGAANKLELNELLQDYTLDDDSRLKLYNNWRAYKESETAYNADKEGAKKDLSKHLATSISDEVANNILRNSLNDFMGSDDRYSYIKDAIVGDLENSPDVKELLAVGKNNFFTLVRALGSPSEYVHNKEWMGKLAKHCFDTAHNRLQASKAVSNIEKVQKLETQVKRLATAYRDLRSSATGINGSNGVVANRANSAKSKQSSEVDQREFEALLSGNLNIEDILDAE